MRRLDIDLLPRPRVPLVAWALLGAALVIAVDAGIQYTALNEQIAVAERSSRSGRADPARSARPAKPMEPSLAKDFGQAEQVIRRLSLPWDELFRAVEVAATDRIALLTVQPDSQKGEVSISGEAADYLAVLAFVSRLEQPGRLSGVHLVRHETKQDDPQHPTAFIIAANWRPER